ncbi:MAG: hypothetical protein NVS2B3_19540 [Vulcanimicrobiaceae bacterium]
MNGRKDATHDLEPADDWRDERRYCAELARIERAIGSARDELDRVASSALDGMRLRKQLERLEREWAIRTRAPEACERLVDVDRFA